MNNCQSMTRRDAVTTAMGAAGILLAGAARADAQPEPPLKGRIKQSVARWCYSAIPLDTLCDRAKAMGILGIDLLRENEWDRPSATA